MKRRFAVLMALGLVLVLAGAACASKTKTGAGGSPSATEKQLSTLSPGVLKVGSCLDYKPFEYKEGGVLKGFDVDLVEEIGKRLHLRVEWVKADFDTIFTALAGGQFDAVAAAATIKTERLQVVAFSLPYYNARQSLTVNTQKSPSIQSTDDLKSGDVIGVQKGTTGKDWAVANLEPNGVQIKTYTSITDAFTDLEAGQIVGVVNDEPSSIAEAQSRPGLKVVEPIDTHERYGIAVSKDHEDITSAINTQLKAIVADGTYKTLFEKYFPGLPLPPEFEPTA